MTSTSHSRKLFALKLSVILTVGIPIGISIGHALAIQEGNQDQKKTPGAVPQRPSEKRAPRFAGTFQDEIPPCSKQHCQDADPVIKKICEKKGWGPDVQIPTREPNGTLCYCSCSCLAYNTQIAIPNGTKGIQDFRPGDPVLVVSDEKGQRKWVPGKVRSASPPAGGGPTPINYTIRIKVGGKILTSNGAHVYMMVNGNFKRADRLIKGDELMSSKFQPAKVESVAHGVYYAALANIETDADGQSTNGHLIDSEGVISGDYFIQKTMAAQAGLVTEPQVGSPNTSRSIRIT